MANFVSTGYNSIMIFEFWTWWYGAGWADAVKRVGQRISGVWQMFSVGILIGTLFYPWKRIITPPGKSFDAIIRGMIDNTVSRFVGFFVRIFAIIAAMFVTTFVALFGLFVIVVWPILPAAAVYLLVRSLVP